MVYSGRFSPRNVYVFSLGLLAFALPWSKFLISVSLFALLINWLLEGGLAQKGKKLSASPFFWITAGLYLLHAVSLFYSHNLAYGLNDLRVKIPLALLPLVVFSSEKIEEKTAEKLLLVFCLSTIAFSSISTLVYLFVKDRYPGIPEMISSLISHIRLSLMVDFSILFLCWFSFTRLRVNFKLSALSMLGALWLLFFLFLLKSITGPLLLLPTAGILGFWMLSKMKGLWKKSILISATGLVLAASVIYLYDITKDYFNAIPVDLNTLEDKTLNGNPYEHHPEFSQRENGHQVGLYICWPELEKEWGEKSKVPFYENDAREQSIRFTLLRYLTSMGLRKDSAGLSRLNAEDIARIERGETNYLKKSAFRNRLESLLFELEMGYQGSNPSGRSLLQRVEYWGAARAIISQNPWVGVGAGDVNDAFMQKYTESNSRLGLEWRKRSHNQFLSFWAGMGILGLLLFVSALLLPALFNRNNMIIPLVFIVLLGLSCLSEDTLETQAGVTFFAYFYCILPFFSSHAYALGIRRNS